MTAPSTGTALNTSELRAMLAAATCVPWMAEEVDGDVWGEGNRERVCRTSSYAYGPDAALIAAAVNNLEALLDAADERDALRAAVEAIAKRIEDRAPHPVTDPAYSGGAISADLRAALATNTTTEDS